ncbi:hypothetical protein [Oceanobacillus profundus]|uniref:hypothetical protein n=1 Tax=Oceanobacillus profundus TaxID=372463 RepID=UPI0026E3C07A|nr:hypothetical protein [Oceanobacillus profundus]MDO6450494.1 hypothetical protein [Oceanobacillus profundus]
MKDVLREELKGCWKGASRKLSGDKMYEEGHRLELSLPSFDLPRTIEEEELEHEELIRWAIEIINKQLEDKRFR